MTFHRIIIPTANQPIAITAAIKSLMPISPDKHSVKTIVINNNTSNELYADIHAYCWTMTEMICYFRECSLGLIAVRYRIAAEAKGELLTFVVEVVEVSYHEDYTRQEKKETLFISGNAA